MEGPKLEDAESGVVIHRAKSGAVIHCAKSGAIIHCAESGAVIHCAYTELCSRRERQNFNLIRARLF